jgi:hypothetical protein
MSAISYGKGFTAGWFGTDKIEGQQSGGHSEVGLTQEQAQEIKDQLNKHDLGKSWR